MRILSITVERLPDQDPDDSYLDQEGFEERQAAYLNGDFGFIGVIANAQVQLQDNGVIQTITSGGLWGIEDDSGDDYLKSVEAEQLAELDGELKAVGFDQAAITAAHN